MSYRLWLSEPTADEVRRVAREQLEDAIAGLRDPDGDRTTAVHEARKAVKKVRGMLRLVQPDLPRSAFRRENAALRDAGRLLSGARDADVMRAALAALRERHPDRVDATTGEALEEALAARAGAADGDGGDPAGAAEAAAGALGAILARVDGWPLDGAGAGTLRRGLQRTYARGTAARRAAERDPSVEAFHDWRKRVKDLWYQERLLSDLWPAVLKAQAAESKRLSEHLGDDHDLAVLAGLLPDDEALGRLVAERRAELQRDAASLGGRVYADRPKAVGRRVKRWTAAGGD
jgi:CHAD domain-containing protein